MKFLQFEVEDIFAYRGRSVIDLSHCTAERNMVVVQGRNGHGKTSLLNAVKLLFLGADDPSLRRVGVGSTELKKRPYVVGQPGRWFGVFNTLAKEAGDPARVALSWQDGELDCRAERIFWPTRGGTDYREQITVTRGREEISGAEAQSFLQSLLPKEVVPFFFFDGEQIQSLADAEIGREQSEIERLLGLSFVSVLVKEIDRYGLEKRKAGLPAAIQAEITEAEGLQRTAEAKAEAAERARIDLEEELAELDRNKRRLEAERNRLRGGLSETDRRRMERRIADLGDQRENISNRIAQEIPVEAPALANLELTARAFAMLEEQLSGSADAQLSTRLHRTLPEAVVDQVEALDPPVVISEEQQRQLRSGVAAALVEAGVTPGTQENALLASLSPRKVRALRDRFLVWTQSGESTAGAQADLLRQARQLAHEEAQLRQELDEADIVSDEARRRYAELTQHLEAIDVQVREKVAAHTLRMNDQRTAERDAELQRDIVTRRYAEQENVIRANEEYQLSRKVRQALETYRDERRQVIRGSVEGRLSEKIKILLGPTQLIKDVRLDHNFGITYLDDCDEVIARHSLSAGMRQLAAMAMLWALKEEAGNSLPVIIDTPLGRIDRENRELLMKYYFHEAGNPLVLLPTNTELNSDDLAMMSEHIAMRYEIRNSGGTSAHIQATG